ncbi:MAG: phosphoribosylamine--glycine ligase [Planctomycetota bacterium]|jgi:phosphoribosylamine--glycine ligase
MNVLVLGSGGREHALTSKIAQSPLVDRIFCAPGNGGTAALATSVDIPHTDTRELYRFCKQRGVELVVVGPELPLIDGVVDQLTERGLKVFGPPRRAARLEGSKLFAKQLMRKHSIPTAEFKAFSDRDSAVEYLDQEVLPVAVKADGVCAGKGVFCCTSRKEATNAVDAIMVERRFGDAGKQVIIEELLEGEEVSVFALVGGETILVMAEACDHKRLLDGDLGPNTGGMGVYSPSGKIDEAMWETIERRILVPTVHALRREDSPFTGVLYAGLMLTQTGPRVLEFNVRFGDPEAQALIPRLKSDLVPLLLGAIDGTLAQQELEWDPRPSVNVVLASGGYPDPGYRTGVTVSGLDELKDVPDVHVFHAGTQRVAGRTVTSGGRVLSVTALGDTREAARQRAYDAVRKIRFDGAVYRTDIGATSGVVTT